MSLRGAKRRSNPASARLISPPFVTPANAGVQLVFIQQKKRDSRFRGNDGKGASPTSLPPQKRRQNRTDPLRLLEDEVVPELGEDMRFRPRIGFDKRLVMLRREQ